jgi:hypothetical protein
MQGDRIPADQPVTAQSDGEVGGAASVQIRHVREVHDDSTEGQHRPKILYIPPPRRGYNVMLEGNSAQSVFQVRVQGSLRERHWHYTSEHDAWRQYDRLTFLLRQGSDLRLDGVPELDLLAFRHYLHTLPRGTCVGSYLLPTVHPLAMYCTYLTGKNYVIYPKSYAPCKVVGQSDRGVPEIELTMPLRSVPFNVSIYIRRTYAQKRVLTRDQAIADLELSLCVAQDMYALAHQLGADLVY